MDLKAGPVFKPVEGIADDRGLMNFRLGTKTSIIISLLLTASLLVGLVITYQTERSRLEEMIHDKVQRVLEVLEAAHTQSMLHRGDKLDNNPVIEAMNGMLDNISNAEQEMEIWLFMGPKVAGHQRRLKREEIEPPQDEVDNEVLNSLKPVSRFVSDTLYRYSVPVILGQGPGNNYACFQCHGFDMGIEKGEPIGGFSIAYDATDDLEGFQNAMTEIAIYLALTVCVVWLGTIFIVRKTVSVPITNISNTIRRISENQEDVSVPDPSTANSVEISDLLVAAETFNQHNLQKMRQLRDALDEHDIVSITDVKGVITYANDKFCEISGYSRDELIGANHRIVKSDEHSPQLYQELWRTIANGDTWKGEIKNRKKNGDYYWVKITIVPFMNEKGKPFQYVAIRTNITKQKLIEQSLFETNEELERSVSELADSHGRLEQVAVEQIALSEDLSISRDEANAANVAKSEFLAAMSHEIRTPMTGVMGFADLLLDDDLADKSRDKVFKIKDATRSLMRIINDILDMSKMEAGKMEIENIDFHLPTLIKDALVLFEEKRHDQRAKRLSLETVLDDDFPTGLNSDPTRLRQILINLIGNAVKFTEQGSVRVKGSRISSDQGEAIIRFEIVDTGIGLKPEAIDKLFTEFTQADASISRRYEGTGLGLSICKRLVELMGGEIGVESEFGKGSTFWFTLPYTPSTVEVVAGPITSADGAVHYKGAVPLHILIADDNGLNQQIIFASVSGLGHTAEIAENGMMAVEMHERGQFDLILMDIRMPVMSGPDATRLIREMDEDKAKIPIVALTADAMEEHKKD
jgi:PAS domain S-box-containing protein